jgi:hypothetical protein
MPIPRYAPRTVTSLRQFAALSMEPETGGRLSPWRGTRPSLREFDSYMGRKRAYYLQNPVRGSISGLDPVEKRNAGPGTW